MGWRWRRRTGRQQVVADRRNRWPKMTTSTFSLDLMLRVGKRLLMHRNKALVSQTITLGVLIVTCSSTASTQRVVIPPNRNQVEASSFTGFPFSGQRGRHQIVISTSHLAPLGNPWSVSEVWFRRDMT